MNKKFLLYLWFNTSEMIHHQGSEPEQAANCWFTNLSWHTAGFLTVYEQ